ncbi:protein fantom [Electrophorus electricus]|uniref:protein fantom n=1 Tax=Electrophorus electricus TaxID=8005 RepID=UPI0015CFE963|nr:protein fantom [Electrophorus electricus]
MSLNVDETAGDLPVRDVGPRGGSMLVTQEQNIRSWRRQPQVLKIKDRQLVFRIPREQLEEQCLRLQEENMLLKQHTRTQEQKLRRLSTRLLKLRYGQPGSARRGADTDEAIEELEARVATLECQKEMLHGKLCAARQQILSLCGQAPHRPRTGRGLEGEGGARRLAQTAPACCTHSSLEDSRGIEKLHTLLNRSSISETQHMRVQELEHANQSLRETLKEKEKELEHTIKELHRQQANGHRLTIKDNIDLIRLQKQLSEKSTALVVVQEKFTILQEAYETQLEEGQKSLRESQEALLGKVEELSEQLKQEKYRVLTLEGQLSTTTLSLQELEEFQERVSHLEGEKNLLKKSYDALLQSTLSARCHQEDHEHDRNVSESLREEKLRAGIQRLEEHLQGERREREKLEQEKERLKQEYEEVQEERAGDRAMTTALRETHDHLEKEVLHYRQEVASLKDRLDSVTKEFDMSAEDLSETLMQIKAFRLRQESCEVLCFLGVDGKVEDSHRELVALQAAQAETVLELQKTRDLLQIQYHLSGDLQAELKTVLERTERERAQNKKWATEKDKLLKSRALQINNLQAQLKDIAYKPGGYKWTIPQQYTWTGMDEELVQKTEEENIFSNLQEGEFLLEIHLIGVTFTPTGLRFMAQTDSGDCHELVTFCTYACLDFEVHSTPLASGTQPNYGFTSCYALTGHDLTKLGHHGASVHAELHQALGGVRFITWGRARISLMGALQRRGEQVKGTANITGSEEVIIGALEFRVCLYPQVEPRDRGKDGMTEKWPIQKALDWSHIQSKTQELYDFGGRIPNELVVVLERCIGLSARWPGLLPDAYLTYHLYDLPPHSTPIVPCCADPVFADSATYPLAATADLMEYLKRGSLWLYVFDDSEGQTPPTYLAKTPIPLRALAAGRPIKGDYVLRDPAGSPRGMVRVQLHWRYPFQSPGFNQMPSRPAEMERAIRNRQRLDKRADETEESQRPTAKPRLKLGPFKNGKDQTQPSPPPIKIHRPERSPKPQVSTPKSIQLRAPRNVFQLPVSKSRQQRSTRNLSRVQDVKPVEHGDEEEEEEEEEKKLQSNGTGNDSDMSESAESGTSSGSDIIIPPSLKPANKEDRLRVEILSLLFDPSSSVALDPSVQQVYVEYRLLGVPMETTETPMSLRKPTKGEEIHYNFTKVIHVDTMEAIPLRHYLYTMLEGTDPNQGRLKFTVVSEPLNEEDECEDVGHAYLDLQELLLTGNDVIERQIDIISMDDDQNVVGKLKMSLEAAEALTGIYGEYHKKEKKGIVTENKEEEEEEEERHGDTEK